MGARKWHVARANRHKEVANYLKAGGHYDWAAVALSYAALHWLHSCLSGEPDLRKDERHPRKHTAPSGDAHGGRGTNQLVNATYPEHIGEAYASLFEAGRRTRYDIAKLGDEVAYKLLELQYKTVSDFCLALNKTRDDIPTDRP